VLTLLAVPVIYSLLDDLGRVLRPRWQVPPPPDARDDDVATPARTAAIDRPTH
jgi:hypothetical protein